MREPLQPASRHWNSVGTPPDLLPEIAAVVLAAGLSSRTAPANKLLARNGAGVAMAGRVAQTCAESRVACTYVVTGHQADRVQDAVRAAVYPSPVVFVQAPDYRQGLSASLRAGISALPPRTEGALVCLGDMPLVEAGLINWMIAVFASPTGKGIVAPQWQGRRGNPVLWHRRYFPEMCAMSGDVGARGLLDRHADDVVTVDAHGPGVAIDFDTPDTMQDGTWEDAIAAP